MVHFAHGEIFADRYIIIEEIGRGGMGCVFKAEDRILGITVALKIIKASHSTDPKFVDLFKKETLLGRSVTHKNVVRIHDIGESNGVKYISMDFIEGENLHELIKSTGSLTIRTAINISQKICHALQAAHEKGIVHRDLKPQNVMIDKTGHVYIMDFGLASTISSVQSSGKRTISGTPPYFSPEQAGGEDLDHRSDIYSLGLILYEMVAGKQVFKTTSIEQYIHKHLYESPPSIPERGRSIPAKLNIIIQKCLKKRREERYQSMQDLCSDLESVEISEANRSVNKKFKNIALGAFLLLIVALGTFFVFLKNSRPSPFKKTAGRVVAVMPFENNTGDTALDHIRRHLQTGLILDLHDSIFLHVVSGEEIYGLLQQIDVQDSPQYSVEVLKKIGKKVEVDFFILASYTIEENRLAVRVKIMEPGSWDFIGTKRFEGENSNDYSVIDDINSWIKTQLNFTTSEIAADIDEELVKYTTRSPEALMLYLDAMNLYEQGKNGDSMKALNEAVALDNNFALAYSMIATLHIYQGHPEKGREFLLKAVELKNNLKPRDKFMIEADYYNIYEAEYLKAIHSYRELLSIYDEDEEIYGRIGAIYRNIEEWDDAEKNFQKSLELDPTRLVAQENLVHTYKAQGRYQEALQSIQDHQKLYSDAFSLHMNLSWLHFNEGNFSRALFEVGRASSLKPEYKSPHMLLGHIQTAKGEFLEAEKSYSEHLESENPYSLCQGYYWLANLSLLQGRQAECFNQIKRGMETSVNADLQYDELTFLLLSAYVNLIRENFDGVLRTAEKGRQLAGEICFLENEIWALHLLGLGYIAKGDIRTVLDILDLMKTKITKSGYSKLMRHCFHLNGKILQMQGEPARAVSQFRNAVDTLSFQTGHYDMHGFFYEGLADALIKNRNTAEARQMYEKVIQLTSGRLMWGDVYARSCFSLGELYNQANNKSNAVKYFRLFLTIRSKADDISEEQKSAEKQLILLLEQ
ncbi:MAG: protein kinase [Candidatus Aminicenantes bacterium]|nr:protein kinase [Candidatus Aminicenantes bacterium]